MFEAKYALEKCKLHNCRLDPNQSSIPIKVKRLRKIRLCTPLIGVRLGIWDLNLSCDGSKFESFIEDELSLCRLVEAVKNGRLKECSPHRLSWRESLPLEVARPFRPVQSTSSGRDGLATSFLAAW